MNDTRTIICAARNTLDAVDIRGTENMRKVLGIYDALGTVLQTLDAAVPENAESEEDIHG